MKSNKQIINDVLLDAAAQDKNIVVLFSDSRGSASMNSFAEKFPAQVVEVGIAEQNLVSIAAGLASCGKKSFAVSPAAFLSARSMEQVKVDVAYSGTNVKLIGISGGISYGGIGATHHATNDIAAMASIHGLRVYFPSDNFLTAELIRALLKDNLPAYVRVGRNPVKDIYTNETFKLDKAMTVRDGDDVTIIACGELVQNAVAAAEILRGKNISARVIDMYCLKPLDAEIVIKAARETKKIITVEEHSPFGGLGSMVAQVTAENYPVKVLNLSLPDAPVIPGEPDDVFKYYGLNAAGIANTAEKIAGR